MKKLVILLILTALCGCRPDSEDVKIPKHIYVCLVHISGNLYEIGDYPDCPNWPTEKTP